MYSTRENKNAVLIVIANMMRFSFYCLFCILLLACSKNKAVYTYGTATDNTPVKTFLALGDSYTIGQSVPINDRFPDQTAALLRSNNINMATPDYIATTGWVTTNLQNAIAAQRPVPHDVVTLLIGVNDQYQTHDTTGYRDRFTFLLEKSIELAGGKKTNVFVLSIPDYSVTPFVSNSDRPRIRREIDWFNAINRSVTESLQVTYLDITPSTREAENDPSLLAADRLHPSGIEYGKWAVRLWQLMFPVLR
jgi:lysophospholipase L1-like esterase